LAAILHKLPITDRPARLALPDSRWIEAKADQIIVWVSVVGPGLAELPAAARRFPADTGFNNTFLIGELQLEQWAGVNVKELTWSGKLIAEGHSLPLRDADVWIHPNEPHSHNPHPDRSACRLEIPLGIAVWPATIPGSRRLPLIGLRRPPPRWPAASH
jgi:hypothetical protein